MAHLTENFTAETVLSPTVRQAIASAFEQGWADPKKQSQAASRAARLRDSAIEEISAILGTSPAKLEIVGEPALVHLLALQGFSHGEREIYSSSVDTGKVRAIAREQSPEIRPLPVDRTGVLLSLPASLPSGSVLSLQATNGETGAIQNLDLWRGSELYVVVDGTRSIIDGDLVTGFAASTFDALSWNGPSGVAFINIEDARNYRYPLPHIAPIRTPGSYSLPLLVGAAIALNEFQGAIRHLISLREKAIDALGGISGVEVVAEESGAHSRYLSIIIGGISGEEILRQLIHHEIHLDSGSACSPEDLAPSHVIGSMGYPTTGHLRVTLHPHHTEGSIRNLAKALSAVLSVL